MPLPYTLTAPSNIKPHTESGSGPSPNSGSSQSFIFKYIISSSGKSNLIG
ncbi:hypothetical protein MtrunA17_Chr1g0153101 [Medicago truncatula]|uniref:Uncharacterized protein n=1 Tax=Medicago truncatula TaxID=3880 RepID=A0A396JIX7_MEDTR|nr:hypothetical protein MtrunA17_Chr1g0153101 [Medicago truncatula]